MKFYPLLKIGFLFLFMAVSVQLFAYDEIPAGIVRGKITTRDGKPAAYVSVSIDELNKGAVTNDDGEYVIRKVPVGEWTIKVIAVGKATREKTITVSNGHTTEADFQIVETAQELNEVVVNAQRQKKDTSYYAAKMPLTNLENPQVYSVVSGRIISDQMLTSVDDALRNVSGVQTMWQATGRSGDGGSYYNMRGFVLQTSMRNGIAGLVTNTVDAANIESVEVLKGPSATLYGNVLTSYGGLINRVTKKPYDNFGGSVSVMGGSYGFKRGAVDINTPLDNFKKILFRFNGAYNYQGTFQTEGYARRVFAAPSLLIKPNDRLQISLDAELNYGSSIGQQILFFYSPASQIGYTNANQVPMNYRNSYVGGGLTQKSTSGNYYANVTYKMSRAFTSSTNFSYGHSYSNGFGQYFYLLPKTNDTTYMARADQSTYGNSYANTIEIQQNFNGDFRIGSLRNRLLIGLDYTRINQHQHFKSNGSYFDIVPLNVPGYDYNTMNGTTVGNFYKQYDTTSNVYHYPVTGYLSDYSAYVSDVLNLTDQLSVLAALRADHYENREAVYTSSVAHIDQTVFSPKFGIVYQPVLNIVSLFANYQNSYTNGQLYNAYDPTAKDSVSSELSKPQQANQWEAGIKTNLMNNKLSASLSYYNIRVSDVLRTDKRNPAFAQIQDGTQVSKGVELELNSNPFEGMTLLGGFSYNDSKYTKADADVQGRRPTTASSPWLAHWWLSYQLPEQTSLQGLRFGFGGNYASDNKILNSVSMGKFTLPAYTVLNAAVSYEYRKMVFGIKMDNLTNKHYWTGYTTMNPQMLRQFVASVSCKF